MYRIAILGTENSHALAFAKLLKQPDYADLELAGIYGYDRAANEAIAAEYPGLLCAGTPDAFVGSVDAVLITARFGTHHYTYGLPYLQAGVAAFIDKPFTVEPAHARVLLDAANASGALLCGGSCLKFAPELTPLVQAVRDPSLPMGKLMGGSVTAPINLDNPYGGFFFYSQHLVQMMLTVFGPSVERVYAVAREDAVTCIFRYPDFDVTAHYGSHQYGASLFFQEKHLHCSVQDVTALYTPELTEFAQMLRTGVMPETREALAFPVTILNAIHASFTQGREISIEHGLGGS